MNETAHRYPHDELRGSLQPGRQDEGLSDEEVAPDGS